MNNTIYTEMLIDDKIALANGFASIKTKLIVIGTNDLPEIILTEENSVKDWEHIDDRYVPNTGFIGQFVARNLKGNLHEISDDFSIENREIELQMCIVRNDASEGTIETWYSLGNFYVIKPEGNEVNDNTKFNALDYTTNFNVDFDANYTSTNFPISFNETIANGDYFTAIELAQYTCEQCNVIFGSQEFTNDNFHITSNQFTGGDSCREVMKAISKLAYGWCSIHWDNNCYIDEPNLTPSSESYNTITNDEYYSLTTQKLTYGVVNRVVLGNSSIDGQESVVEDTQSIENNGLTELRINDNPILYTQALQDLASINATVLLGLSYTPLKMETIGHPWLVGNELIPIKNMENVTKYTYPFNRTIKYNGHIKTTIESIADTKQEVEKDYKNAIFKEIRDVHIQVDRQNGVIETLDSRVQTSEDGLQALETKFQETVTDTYSRQEIQEIVKGIGVDGVVVESVQSTSGTFDKNGLTIDQSDANTSTNINANGMIIYNKTGTITDDALLTVNSEGVIAKNIKVQQYLNIGSHSRIEDYVHTDNTEGTGVFWIGSDI